MSQTGFDGHEGACSVAISSPTGGIGLPQKIAHGMPVIGLTMIGCNIVLGCVPGAYVSQTGFMGHKRACLVAISSPTEGIGLPQQVAQYMPDIGLTMIG